MYKTGETVDIWRRILTEVDADFITEAMAAAQLLSALFRIRSAICAEQCSRATGVPPELSRQVVDMPFRNAHVTKDITRQRLLV